MESIKQMIISDSTQIVINIGYVIALIAFIWKVASDQSKMKNEIKENRSDINRHELKIESIDKENIDLKVTQAKIDTKLEGIEVNVLEIKSILKEK